MNKDKQIYISRDDAFQILDCLEHRIQDWNDTAKVLRNESASLPFFIPEECHKPEEAEWVRNRYQAIYDDINKKL